MKKIRFLFYILFCVISVNAQGQLISLIYSGDTLKTMNPLTGVTTNIITASPSTFSIGTVASTAPLTVANFTTSFPTPQSGTMIHAVSDAAINGRISFDTYNNTSFTGSNYQGRRARGTAVSPTPPITDDILVAIGADGYGVDSFTNASVGSMNIRAADTYTNTSKPSYISFTTTPTGSTTQVERFKINADGTVKFSAYGAGLLQTDASGNATAAALTSGQVTTALGFTPYNATNPNSYITSAALSPYLTTALAASTYQPIGTYATGTGTASGTNTGDNAVNSLYSGLVSNATHTGEVTGATALTITAGAVTLAKMADMATSSLIYRKTAGTGAPEVNTLATLKTDLGLTGTNSGDQTITLTGDVTGSGTGSFATTFKTSPSFTTPVIGVATGTSLAVTGLLTSSGTAGIGYAAGAGGTVTQATNRTTGVTLNKISGAITTNATSLAAGAEATFVVTNSTVAIGDVILLSARSGQTTNTSIPHVSQVTNGTFSITLTNLNATTADTGAMVINFVVIKAVSN